MDRAALVAVLAAGGLISVWRREMGLGRVILVVALVVALVKRLKQGCRGATILSQRADRKRLFS